MSAKVIRLIDARQPRRRKTLVERVQERYWEDRNRNRQPTYPENVSWTLFHRLMNRRINGRDD